jgi:DNA-binding protein HU-beta
MLPGLARIELYLGVYCGCWGEAFWKTILTQGDLPMNKLDLIATVAQETDISKAKATEVVEAVFGAIEKSLKQKEEVRLVGFGTFVTAAREASKGRNPRTGEEIDIPASTSVRFKAGKTLKDAVN